ncbi:hypothetical protein PV08_03107 [Exophiala spinifera]|uniref:Uncharacterized protein n=1 Tax=Exophiala spinifera TaxID=91928 RepID=A0A0D2BIQ9_9EURO|nr:uncharacterized protein PV08_03107 [Exophiala spinifera]KIW18818.1 hypothetical protein PV08_03107 [Exophiala spinifera]
MGDASTAAFDVPKECWAAVVKDEGPNFYVEVEKVPVPEIGKQMRNRLRHGQKH